MSSTRVSQHRGIGPSTWGVAGFVAGLAMLIVALAITGWASVDDAGASGPLPAPVDQAEDGRIAMPLVMRRADRDDLIFITAVPTTAVPPTPTLTPTPTATPGPSPTPTPPACAEPLENRLIQRTIEIDGRIESRSKSPWTSVPIITSVLDDGRQVVAWPDTGGDIHFTPISAEGARDGDDITQRGETVHGFVAHEDGGAALIARPDDMDLVRFDADGEVRFEKTLVGDGSRGRVGSKWIDDWGHEGRLVWTDEIYAAYFGHTQMWDNGRHQGDLLWLYDGRGEQLDFEQAPGHYPQWSWGCSHSLDLRLAYNRRSDALGPVCISDGYPTPGFHFSHRTQIGEQIDANGSGWANGELGGIVPVGRGFALTYLTEEGRRSMDVALALLDDMGFVLEHFLWLTDTPSVDESAPHLATYGENLLASWTERGQLMLAVVDLDGQVIEGPVGVDADIGARDDFVNYPNGDVGWTAARSDRGALVSVVIPYCRPDA